MVECIRPNAGDWQAIDRTGDGHNTTGTCVSRDGNRAAIGPVGKLSLHQCGKRQQKDKPQQPRGAGGLQMQTSSRNLGTHASQFLPTPAEPALVVPHTPTVGLSGCRVNRR